VTAQACQVAAELLGNQMLDTVSAPRKPVAIAPHLQASGLALLDFAEVLF
jgi:hypothetical protein